ncbi:hypothetical protein ACRAWF_31090 [Streptomyces sp. L7]
MLAATALVPHFVSGDGGGDRKQDAAFRDLHRTRHPLLLRVREVDLLRVRVGLALRLRESFRVRYGEERGVRLPGREVRRGRGRGGGCRSADGDDPAVRLESPCGQTYLVDQAAARCRRRRPSRTRRAG